MKLPTVLNVYAVCTGEKLLFCDRIVAVGHHDSGNFLLTYLEHDKYAPNHDNSHLKSSSTALRWCLNNSSNFSPSPLWVAFCFSSCSSLISKLAPYSRLFPSLHFQTAPSFSSHSSLHLQLTVSFSSLSSPCLYQAFFFHFLSLFFVSHFHFLQFQFLLLPTLFTMAIISMSVYFQPANINFLPYNCSCLIL